MYGAPQRRGLTKFLSDSWSAERVKMNKFPDTATSYRCGDCSSRWVALFFYLPWQLAWTCPSKRHLSGCYVCVCSGSLLVSLRIDFNEKFREHSVPHAKKALPLPDQVRHADTRQMRVTVYHHEPPTQANGDDCGTSSWRLLSKGCAALRVWPRFWSPCSQSTLWPRWS